MVFGYPDACRGRAGKRPIVPGVQGMETTRRSDRMADDRNRGIIDEFHANEGRVGGFFEGASMLLLHTVGVKTGRPRVNPLVYLPDGDRYVIFATKGGAPTNPDWYSNLLAHPDVEIEVGTETIPVRAAEIHDDQEREALYARQVERRPGFAEYPKKTDRRIPIIALERR
jgi:deazaflavin-dependent oxidoreductase (nitroreductase family)